MRIMDNFDNRGQKVFPELPYNFPDELLDETWAHRIHDQSLKRLNERGGLTIMELLMNLNKWTLKELLQRVGYNYKATEKDAAELLQHIRKYEIGPVSSGLPCTFKDNPPRVEPL